MSITITATILITDLDVLKESTEELGYTFYEEKTEVVLHESVEYGYPIFIPGWRYPVVLVESGELRYDNNKGKWGDQTSLDILLQTYSVKKVLKEIKTYAQNNGYKIIKSGNKIKLLKDNKELEIELDKQEIIIDAKGFVGTKCKEEIDNLNINLKVKSENIKPEYYEKETKTQNNNTSKESIWIL